MILRDSLFWRNVAEHSFLLIIVSAHSLASLLFLLSDEFFDSKLQKKGVFQQTVNRLHRNKEITDLDKQGAAAHLRLLSHGWRETFKVDTPVPAAFPQSGV